ncbi:30S ribosomal protein S6 [Euhalothece natronophila Z-M001]|uniref:Small ribosomal subunit protein bS6 n=1 Tax=Euhalothece natronophila Z-M001 TaxID=522448 RepID=A0A5B8NIY1_9CHRO|nr:30S ribosomal protein S6 [Euhalothece natronophila]QDZ39213.1 30S ribosomal protein S6 [Euhalothece natronophila Z-M001]
MLNNYETMFIIRPDLSEDQVTQEVKKYEEFLQQQGVEEIRTRNHGKKRLAYMIGKHQDGIYVQLNYRVDGSAIKPLQRQMRLSDNVIRFLTLTVDQPPQAAVETTPTTVATPERKTEPVATEEAATPEEPTDESSVSAVPEEE